jgi:hypothetical protein
MAPIHDRMPLMLEPEDWPVWLGEQDGDPDALLRPAGDDVAAARTRGATACGVAQAGGVVPVRLRVLAFSHNQHVRQAAGQAEHVGAGGVQGVEPVQRVRAGAGDAKRVHWDHVLP